MFFKMFENVEMAVFVLKGQNEEDSLWIMTLPNTLRQLKDNSGKSQTKANAAISHHPSHFIILHIQTEFSVESMNHTWKSNTEM